jgi:hypothetical protein
MVASSPALSIETQLHPNGQGHLEVTLRSRAGETQRLETRLTTLRLAEYRHQCRKGLDEVRQVLTRGGVGKNIERGAASLRLLGDVGNELLVDLFGRAQAQEVSAFAQRAIPHWGSSGSSTHLEAAVEVRSIPEYALPFEFFPLFGAPPTSAAISNIDDLAQFARRILGFSTAVYRVLLRPGAALLRASSQKLNNVPRLRIRLFWHAGLYGAHTEHKHLVSNPAQVELLGPWPNGDTTPESFDRDLISRLWHALSESVDHGSGRADHVHHFSTHCDTATELSGDYSISLAHHGLFRRQSWSISLQTLKRGFARLDMDATRLKDQVFPLVFLNACGTSSLTPNGVSSFTELFLDYGNCGVVGTETGVPDSFAAKFSEEFYRTFLQGHSLGHSMYRARWNLLRRHNNPLGILYVAYGDPDLCVVRPATN